MEGNVIECKQSYVQAKHESAFAIGNLQTESNNFLQSLTTGGSYSLNTSNFC
jgi:hypothetical protein